MGDAAYRGVVYTRYENGPTREERSMDARRAQNLEEMDERQALRFLTELASELSPEKEYASRHEAYTMEMPQSGERFRGRENM